MTKSAADPIVFDLQTARNDIDKHLDRYTKFDDNCPNHLQQAIRYTLLNAGKRLRPLLVLMSSRACGGKVTAAMPAACAVEMIHTYSLIHDDLPAMDDDQLRRGRPTCHIQFDEATAILAGDALIPLAFETMADEYPPEIAARCCVQLAHACGATQLVGGQADDLAKESNIKDIQRLENIHRRKTGALLTVSTQLGGIVAEAQPEQLTALESYGQNLGLAFQIVDDLLDCRGDWTKMGKMTNKDRQLGKLTYPDLLGVEESQARATTLIGFAISAIDNFDELADPLRNLAKFVMERNQ